MLLFWNDNRRLEARAKHRFIPARKHAPRIRRLHLAGEHQLLACARPSSERKTGPVLALAKWPVNSTWSEYFPGARVSGSVNETV